MITGATLFSGGDGVGIGMKNAGITHLWGIEINDSIAQVARDNGFNTITANVLLVDPATMDRPDILHASPVCTRASVANSGAEEAEIDILAAEKTAEFIRILQPRVFTLENVYPYRKFRSFDIICDQLAELGYWLHYANLNSADFGVPQTRRRLVLRAVRGSMLPLLPPPEPWVGWYEAIEDLIPTLPDSKFADWQLKKLGDINNSLIDGDGNRSRLPTVLDSESTSMTIQAWHGRRPSCIPQAQIQGRVVKMTPRALARFQSFPDWYKLPEKTSLAIKIIGNAVPPLMYQKIIDQLVQCVGQRNK